MTPIDPLTALRNISAIPSSPFLPKPRISFMQDFIGDMPLEVIPNDYALILKIGKSKNKRKLVLMTHLDHPGIVLKDRHEGIIFGSVGHDRIIRHLQKGPIPIKIYDPSGKFITRGQVIKLFGRHNQNVNILTDRNIPTNSSASWDLEDYYSRDNQIFAYAADNDVPTAVMLALLSRHLTPQYETYFVFNYFEEVHQVSSYHLAKHNTLHIDENDLVLNLESMKVGNYDHPNVTSSLNYNDGVVLQINELNCLYGSSFSKENLLEELIVEVATSHNIKLQRGLGKGSNDARPFSYFNLSPNICTLNVPNRFKHNHGNDDEFLSEMIYKTDILDMYHLVENLVNRPVAHNTKPKYKSISLLAKQSDSITSLHFLKRKALLNERLDLSYRRVIETRQYYQLSYPDKLFDLAYKLYSYITYPYLVIKTIY